MYAKGKKRGRKALDIGKNTHCVYFVIEKGQRDRSQQKLLANRD